MDFYQIISLVAVVAFVILVIYAVSALIQVKKTAESVEYLALTTAEKVDQTQSTFELIHNISSVLDNGFYKAIALGVDVARRWHKKSKED